MYNEFAIFEPPRVVTIILAEPATPVGVVTLILVALLTTTFVAATPPIVTLVGLVNPEPVKLVPVIVTCCPPPNGPVLGLTLVTVGAAT